MKHAPPPKPVAQSPTAAPLLLTSLPPIAVHVGTTAATAKASPRRWRRSAWRGLSVPINVSTSTMTRLRGGCNRSRRIDPSLLPISSTSAHVSPRTTLALQALVGDGPWSKLDQAGQSAHAELRGEFLYFSKLEDIVEHISDFSSVEHFGISHLTESVLSDRFLEVLQVASPLTEATLPACICGAHPVPLHLARPPLSGGAAVRQQLHRRDCH